MTSRAKWIAGGAMIASILLYIVAHESRGLPLSGLSDHPSDAQAREREASRGASFGSLSPHAAESQTCASPEGTARVPVIQTTNLDGALRALGWRDKLAPAFSLLGLNLDVQATVQRSSWGGFDQTTIMTEDQMELVFDNEFCMLTKLKALSDKVTSQEVRDEDALSETEAKTQALKLVEILGLSDDLSHTRGTFVGTRGIAGMTGGSWAFTLQREYGDFETLSALVIGVSCCSGNVVRFTNIPFVVPEGLAGQMSEHEARVIAEDAMRERGFTFDECYSAKWLFPSRLPDNPWTAPESEVFSPRDFRHARACYQFRYSPPPQSTPRTGLPVFGGEGGSVLYVDCLSGEIVDGVLPN